MNTDKQRKLDDVRRFELLLEKQTGRAVRPYRADGYVNLLNRYGTSKDTSEQYQFEQEPSVPDDVLTSYYEGNGLFARIIDAPAEEAIKHGFKMKVADKSIEDFYVSALDELDWEETAMTAIKWTRLFGGCIVVMLINDGRGIDEPVDWKNVKSIDDLRVYERPLIQEDTSALFEYRPDDPFRTRSSRLGMPEYYNVYSKYGNFRVHDSRCLVFQNGTLPENTSNSIYQMWGIPEYIRINKAIRDAEIAHGSATKLLDRSVQPVYKMKDLAAELASDEGEGRVLRRLQTIDMARGLLNSITIDAEGEDYDFRTFSFSGVSDVIDSTCNYLSALTCIPQTILFGRSPAGMNSTGTSDLENWYNYIERIQMRMIKKNLRYLLSVVFQAGVACGEIDEVPEINIEFNSLWSLSETEKISVEQQKAALQHTKAQTAQLYMDAQVIDPSEVRKKLADSDEFDIDTLLDEYDEEELFANMPQGGEGEEEQPEAAEYGETVSQEEHSTDDGGNAPTAAPAATKLPEDMSKKEKVNAQNQDGGPGSGHFGHNGVEGQRGGSMPKDTGTTNNTSGDYQKYLSNATQNGYTKTSEYKETASRLNELRKKSNEYYAKKKELSEQIKSESTPKPKSEWDDEDWYQHLVGNKPMTYTDKGRELKGELDSINSESLAIDKEISECNDTLLDMKRMAHDEQVENYETSTPKEATQSEYEGFDISTTGTGMDRKLTSSDSYIAEMSPQEYLERCAYEIFTNATIESTLGAIDTATVNEYADKMASGTKFDMPYLDYENEGQEGRHRAAAAMQNGITTIPILVVGYDDGFTVNMKLKTKAYRPWDSDYDSRDDGVKSSKFSNIPRNGAVATLVVADGCILTGIRQSEFGNGLVCCPGGHVEDGETFEEAAIRETREEFGITPKDMILLGYGPWEPDTGLKPAIYLATEYEGEIQNVDGEIEDIHFRSMAELDEMDKALFQPFKDALSLMVDVFDSKRYDGEEAVKNTHTSTLEYLVPNPVMQKVAAQEQNIV